MRYLAILFATLFAAGCSRQEEAHTPVPATGPEPVAVTNWTERTELFMEYPPLVVGQKGRAAVHFTNLKDFSPVGSGVASVELTQSDRVVQSFRADGPSRPGIFGIDLEPAQPGKYLMAVTLDQAGFSDRHELGEVTVHATAGELQDTAAPAGEETIPFLKEQQWTLDFATEIARPKEIRESLRVAGDVRPRSGGEVVVVAPIAGRIATRSKVLPVGSVVRAGQDLASIVPAAADPADLPSLQLELEEAKSHLLHTRRDRERAERLIAAGAAPQKRLHEAQEEEVLMAARLKAAEAKLAMYEESRQAGGTESPSVLFRVKSPIAGIVASASAIPGATTAQNETLFRIIETDNVYVVASIPESEAWRVAGVTGAEIELPGLARPRPLPRLVSDTRMIDPESRTLSLLYETENLDRRLAIGQAVTVRLFLPQTSTAVAIPEGAVIDDGGRPVVFVQLEGESFARRPVRLAARAGGYVQVVDGVKPGERVVTRGAYLIRLAALSPTIPAHGHVH